MLFEGLFVLEPLPQHEALRIGRVLMDHEQGAVRLLSRCDSQLLQGVVSNRWTLAILYLEFNRDEVS